MKTSPFLIAFSAALAISCAADGPKQRATVQLSDNSSQRQLLTVNGLAKIGDAPDFDSPALAIICVDENTCWINSPRKLWRSVDSGKHWQEVYRSRSDEDEIQACHFVSSEYGWRISYHKLFVTHDGGYTWAEQPSPFEYPTGESRSLWFLGQKTGWIAGGTFRTQTPTELKFGVPNNARDVTGKMVLEQAVFQTTDGGKTWKKQSFQSSGGASIGRILRVRFLNDLRGVALGERNFYYTSDGGNHWLRPNLNNNCVRSKYKSDYDASPANVEMLDARNWWITYDDGRIIRSADGGNVWCDFVQPEEIPFDEAGHHYFTVLHFDTAAHGWGLGWDRFLYETKDAGKHWTRVSSEIKFDSMDFPNKSNGFLVSHAGIFGTRHK